MKILTFDIGGTKIAYAYVNEKGEIISQINKVATPQKCEDIESLFVKISANDDFDGTAVATAGVVFNGKVQGKPYNLPDGYQYIDFEKIFNRPCLVENDANSALWAEYKIGVLQNTTHAAMLTLGTGIGCGLILNGKLYRGKQGAAGEVNFPVSGWTLADIAHKNQLDENDCFKIYELAQNHNIKAITTYDIWQKNLIASVIILNQILDLEGVALSGSLARIVNYDYVEGAINRKMSRNPIFLKKAKCDINAGLIGAALLLAEKIKGEK